MGVREEIEKYCEKLGLDTIGFIKCRTFEELRPFYSLRKINGTENEFEETDIEKRINPNSYMEDGKTIISIAFPYLHDVEYFDNGFSKYTRGEDYHKVVKSYLNKVCEFINTLGGEAIALVDSNTLPERYIAYLAGVGFIGKNNMIITEKYGSYVFLGEIITNLDIHCNESGVFEDIKKFNKCGSCEECYSICPSKSINKYKKNSNICVSYLTQKKDLEDKYLKLMKGKVFGCDSCQDVCPFNKNINFSKIEKFKPLDFMNENNDELVINLSNKGFKETLLLTSCGWRGKNVLKRNILIKKYNGGDNITTIKIDSPYIKDYWDRLLKLNKL